MGSSCWSLTSGPTNPFDDERSREFPWMEYVRFLGITGGLILWNESISVRHEARVNLSDILRGEVNPFGFDTGS